MIKGLDFRGTYNVRHKSELKGNVAVYKDLNLEFVTKNSSCHEFAARKCY